MKASPSLQFYPSDWLRAPGLRSCSLAARGLWIDMLAFMHEAEPYGHLRINGQDLGPAALARMVGSHKRDVHRLLAELEQAGVFSRTEQGTIFSRRMVRDQELHQMRARYGHLSANHPDVPRKKDRVKDTMKDTLSPSIGVSLWGSPSSSSSSSSSSSKKKKDLSSNYSLVQNNGHLSGLNIFWKVYPRKEGKGACEDWWIRNKPDDVLLGTMLAKIEQAKKTRTWQKDDGEFIPMPLTWLNQKRWKDDYPSPKPERLPL